MIIKIPCGMWWCSYKFFYNNNPNKRGIFSVLLCLRPKFWKLFLIEMVPGYSRFWNFLAHQKVSKNRSFSLLDTLPSQLTRFTVWWWQGWYPRRWRGGWHRRAIVPKSEWDQDTCKTFPNIPRFSSIQTTSIRLQTINNAETAWNLEPPWFLSSRARLW